MYICSMQEVSKIHVIVWEYGYSVALLIVVAHQISRCWVNKQPKYKLDRFRESVDLFGCYYIKYGNKCSS